MPDYPLEVIGHDGEWVKPPNDNDDGSVPTADYVDEGAGNGASLGGGRSSSGGSSSEGGAGGMSGDNGRDRLGYSIRQQKIDAALSATSSSGPGIRPDDHRPFSDFVVSLLRTVQLTPLATLKKSKGKPPGAAVPATKTAVHQPQHQGGNSKPW